MYFKSNKDAVIKSVRLIDTLFHCHTTSDLEGHWVTICLVESKLRLFNGTLITVRFSDKYAADNMLDRLDASMCADLFEAFISIECQLLNDR